MTNIHSTAIIEDGAKIGENVTIGAYSYIGKNVTIGDGSIVDTHTLIEGYTIIGKNNHIFSHATIGSMPQDLKYNGEKSELIIGDNNKIREYTLINPGTEGGGMITKVGSNNLLMGYVHLGHDVIMGDNCILANCATLAGHVELGDNVFIGGMTPVHQFVKIGSYAAIGGASALSQDIPPFCMAQGNHAKVRGLNLTGLRRNLSREDIDELKNAYRELFEQGKPLQDTAKKLALSSESNLVKNLANFIIDSKRGIPFEREQK
jgi:UDP-N-acetylglucosamine acyltransferase